MIDPYSVLGVEADADFMTLRASYRRLVRDNHPDVTIDKDVATQRMSEINEAWLLVGAPEKRAHYDALLRLKVTERASQLGSEEQNRLEAQHRARAQNEKRNRSATSRVRAKPNAHTPTKKVSNKVRDQQAEAISRTVRTQNPAREVRLLRKISQASQLFHREGRIEEASAICREVLLADGRNVQARELLGDIMAFQGRVESALMMFDQAIQIAPQDRMLRRKRDRLEMRQSRSHTKSPTAKSFSNKKASKKPARPSLLRRICARLRKSSR